MNAFEWELNPDRIGFLIRYGYIPAWFAFELWCTELSCSVQNQIGLVWRDRFRDCPFGWANPGSV